MDRTLCIVCVLAVIGLAVWWFCFKGKSVKEGYKRSCLANDCYGLQRTPVDYAFKNPDGWQRNPHWQANPSSEYQPLDQGPIDFFQARRKLHNKTLFKQYRGDWGGCGNDAVTLTNDEKNRFDLTNVGDYGARLQLDDMRNPRFLGKGPAHTERTYDQPNPFFDKIYGGRNYLVHDKLGD